MYNNLFFFYCLILVLVPVGVMGINGVYLKRWGVVLNFIMLWIFFSGRLLQLGIYIALETILVWSYFTYGEKLSAKFRKKTLLRVVLLLSLMPLLVIKLGEVGIRLPVVIIGISYITFRVVQVILEIHDGLIKEFSLVDFVYFISFFPTITSGPIDRYRRFIKDVYREHEKEKYNELLKRGIFLLLTGILFKFAFAGIVSYFWMNKVNTGRWIVDTLSYMYSYSFFLYFDFCGYSLMAMGAGYVLGIQVPKNFNKPFLSTDIKDFWNRWHMSLSFWFRDYIYSRFVLSGMKEKWFKDKYVLSYCGYLITMGTMGVWHGVRINYILYGLYHGALICLTDYVFRKYNLNKKIKKDRKVRIISTFITFNLICFGFLIFSGNLIK